jgi:hypothetical protein
MSTGPVGRTVGRSVGVVVAVAVNGRRSQRPPLEERLGPSDHRRVE